MASTSNVKSFVEEMSDEDLLKGLTQNVFFDEQGENTPFGDISDREILNYLEKISYKPSSNRFKKQDETNHLHNKEKESPSQCDKYSRYEQLKVNKSYNINIYYAECFNINTDEKLEACTNRKQNDKFKNIIDVKYDETVEKYICEFFN